MPPPNILFIGTDQWRGDALGYAGNESVLTPNLDQLASRSTVFTRCITASPLCVPARAAVMTAQLPRENGVWSNARAADLTAPSHVRSIRQAGYHTAVIGKTHLWRTGPGPRAGLHAKDMDHVLEAWGFDERVEVNDPIGTGTQGCAYTDFVSRLGFEDAHRNYILNWIDELRNNNPTPWAQPPAPVPEYMDIDSFIGSSAVHWLQSYDSSKPFYLQVQFTGPHDPYDGPQPFRSLYDDINIDIGIKQRPKNPPPTLKSRIRARSTIVEATDTQRRDWRINYYANITLIDYWIGKILETLEATNRANDTLIVFTSDHGEMLGDLGLMGKTVFFEPAVHVPLLCHLPNQDPQSVSSLVSHVSIPMTLLEVSRSGQVSDSVGHSLLSSIHSDSKHDVAPCVYSELFGETTVVTDRYKLTVNTESNEPTQLLDRVEDPLEIENFVDDASYANTQEELIAQFLRPIAPRINQSVLARYIGYTQKFRRLN